MPDARQDVADVIARQQDVPEIVARIMAARGVAAEEAEAFLNPRLAAHFPDPFSLSGMAGFADDLALAVTTGRKIAVFGDFDVDGATSAAVMVRFFRHLGLEVPFYIPDRMKEGYGPNETALRILRDQGAEIVILCDCGTTAFGPVAAGRAMGLSIAVLDHHEAEEVLPDADHVINPKRRDDRSGLNMLAACGVSFLACVAINARLRERGFYKERGLAEAPLRDWLDIVALGTVCDMVPLTGPNRLLVRAGFARMAQRGNPGIAALCKVAGIAGDPNAYHAGFMLGPRINAGSRVHRADLGARLLATDDAEEAQSIAWTLNDCNEQRKEIQEEMTAQAEAMVAAQGIGDAPLIIVGHEEWHPGLSGLVAGRLREKYNRPAVVITYAPGPDSSLEGRGSGRSVPGVNMGAAFIDARQAGLLLKGGGHAMAAGFTVEADKVAALSDFLIRHVAEQAGGRAAVSETVIDGVLSVRGARPDFVRLIQERMGPFGQGHEEPVFVLPHVRIHMADVVGKDHVRVTIGDWDGGGGRMKAVAFRAADTKLGQALLTHGRDRPFHLAGYFKIDSWNGREQVEMHIQDAAFALAGMQVERIPA